MRLLVIFACIPLFPCYQRAWMQRWVKNFDLNRKSVDDDLTPSLLQLARPIARFGGLVIANTIFVMSSFRLVAPMQPSYADNYVNLASDVWDDDDYNTEDSSSTTIIAREPPRSLSERFAGRLNEKKVAEVGEKEIINSIERVLTLSAYINEIERNVFEKNFDLVQTYLNVIVDQEDAFAILIDKLFPNDTPVEAAYRSHMTFQAQKLFTVADDLREAVKDNKAKVAQRLYCSLLVSYDSFLKAGDLYPTYDPITSTEVFYRNIPPSALHFDRVSKVKVLDQVVMMQGPDMGKGGVLLCIDTPTSAASGTNIKPIIKATVHLNRDGKDYQEAKVVDISWLAKAAPEPGRRNLGYRLLSSSKVTK